jgi:acetyl esterase
VPDGYLLDRAAIDDYLAHYLADPAQAREPWCSPLLADDHRGLPPAWIMTAEYDKLRGDGEAYASALAAAGVPATHVRLDGHIHPSFAFTRLLPSARAYQDQAIAALRSAFEG